MTNYSAEIVDGIVVNVVKGSGEGLEPIPDSIKVGVGASFSNGTFTTPQPFPSWTLNAENEWEAPVAKPSGSAIYDWYEKEQRWLNRSTDLDDSKPVFDNEGNLLNDG